MIDTFFLYAESPSLYSHMDYIIKTERIGLRNWRESDLGGLSEMNSDPEVMRYFPNALTHEGSIDMLKKLQDHVETHGYTYFLAEKLDTQEFLGFVGLAYQTYETAYTPFVDIGWRLKKTAWGKGYASEAARACLAYAFNSLGIQEVFSVTPIPNKASIKVMEKIGMKKIAEFEHPKIEVGHPLRTCVLYKIENQDTSTS